MNELTQTDIQYLAQQEPEQMRLILSGMAALMQDTEAKAEAMQSQNWFQRMVKTVTGKNKLTRDEIWKNHDKLNMYMAEAVAELYRLGQVDRSIMMSLGTQINEIYMEQVRLKEMLRAFVTELNEKINSVDNFHTLVEEINQGIYAVSSWPVGICKILSRFDTRILKDSRKLGLIKTALVKQNMIQEGLLSLHDYLTEVLDIPMSTAGQIYLELGSMRGSFIAPLTMKVMEKYHFLPPLARKMTNRESLLEVIIQGENLDTSVSLSTLEIYDDFINSKVDVQRGLLPPGNLPDELFLDEFPDWGSLSNASSEEIVRNADRYREIMTQNAGQYRKAADQGQADAQYLLGLCCYYGFGVGEDKGQAVKWYRKAAEQGHTNAQYKLGECYYYGDGVRSDRKESKELMKKAAEQGQESAQVFLKQHLYPVK